MKPFLVQPVNACQRIAVLGAGAWGTALAIHLAKGGHRVTLWAHRAEVANQLALDGENKHYLPGIAFPAGLSVSSNLQQVCANIDAVLFVVPSHVFSATLTAVKPFLEKGVHIAWATKGFEPETGRLLHEVAQAVLGKERSVAVLSGPTFAIEVAQGLPTAMVSASSDALESQFWLTCFQHLSFRMYTQSDVIGVEVGGAYKNIMAVATGLSDGLGLGANARAALVSRGLAEMSRFALALGGSPETLMGLAGMGDLVLTCTDDKSRNRRFGLLLARSGQSPEAVIAKIGQVVEGVKAVKAVKKIADDKKLDLPIMEQVYAIVVEGRSPAEAVKRLMARSAGSEHA